MNTKEQQNSRKCAVRRIRQHWAASFAALFIVSAGLIYLAAGDRAQIAVADNLDLFQAQYQMLKNTGTFWSQNASAPFLHGISRDVLPGECSLEAVLYQLLPSLPAYVVMYLVKVALGTVSFALLAGELQRRGALESCGGRGTEDSGGIPAAADEAFGTEGKTHPNLAVLAGLTYGCLNLFPSFGISFASIPLAGYLILRLVRAENRKSAAAVLAALFFYPWVSYFSYFGIFLIGYLVLALGVVLVKSEFGRPEKKRAAVRLLLAVLVLSAGYVLWEHRLFAQMLLSDEESIRNTMVQTSLSAGEILQWIGKVLVNGVDLHCESAHRYVVLPVCTVYLLILNAGYVRRKEAGRIPGDLYNMAAALLLFNSIVYGLYYCESFRNLAEHLVPQLKGFQFSRTSFFNPFLWYGMFYLALYRLLRWGKRNAAEGTAKKTSAASGDAKAAGAALQKGRGKSGRITACAAYGLMLAAFLAVHACGNTYNDLQHTAKALVKQFLGKEPDNTLSYGEFYSERLFEKACESIGYQGEWAAAYGFHPAVLEYSGIATIDGYLGFYSESYKQSFRKVIAPALEQNESSRIYYDEWGARCYLYSADNLTIVEAVRNYPHTEDTIAVDSDALKELDCRYIFSRIHITNSKEAGLELIGTFTDESSPYVLYVYEVRAEEP